MGATQAETLIVDAYLHCATNFLDSLEEQVLIGGMALEDWISRVRERLNHDAERGLEAVVSDIVARADQIMSTPDPEPQ